MSMRNRRERRREAEEKKRQGTGVDDVVFLDGEGKPEPLGFSGVVRGEIIETGDNGEPQRVRLKPVRRAVASVGDLMRLEADADAGRWMPRPSLLVQFVVQIASWHGRVRPRNQAAEAQGGEERSQ